MSDKKINLARFKKSTQGFMDFVNLIEQADPQLRDRIMEEAKADDAEFYARVMKKVVFFDELTYLDDGVIAEILSSVSPKILAFALYGMPQSFRDKLLKLIGFREMRLVKDEEEKMSGDIQRGLILGAQKQIIKTARGLEAQNKFIFELSDCPRLSSKKAVA